MGCCKVTPKLRSPFLKDHWVALRGPRYSQGPVHRKALPFMEHGADPCRVGAGAFQVQFRGAVGPEVPQSPGHRDKWLGQWQPGQRLQMPQPPGGRVTCGLPAAGSPADWSSAKKITSTIPVRLFGQAVRSGVLAETARALPSLDPAGAAPQWLRLQSFQAPPTVHAQLNAKELP